MSKYGGRRVFTAGRAMIIVSMVVALIFIAGAAFTYLSRGWSWVSIGMTIAALAAIAGIVEAFVLRIELTDDALHLRELYRRRSIQKSHIAGIEEAKGVPPALTLIDGKWVKLPGFAHLGNSVRAWLKSEG